jgi:hypothetical protein
MRNICFAATVTITLAMTATVASGQEAGGITPAPAAIGADVNKLILALGHQQ